MFDSIGKNYIKLGSDTLAPEFWGIGGIDEVFYINVPSDHIPTSGGYMMDKVKENDDGTVKWKVEGYGPEIVSSASETVKIDYESMETTFNYGKKYSELVKENDTMKNIPLIIFSSLINDEIRRKGESLGADAQLTKPEIGKLIGVVDELVAKYESARKGN